MMKKLFVAAVLLFPLTLMAALPSWVPGQGELPSLADMLEQVNPAVVNIATHTTTGTSPLMQDERFRRFFNLPRRREMVSAGSGVVIDAGKGYIVTNHHVIDRANRVTVGLADGRNLTAELVGSDPSVDLAVLRVDPDELSEITFADSADLRVGDFVVAIGNPFGLNQTVTSGIVSALGRSGLNIEGYEDFIQTDAPINPGNSGGALVDLEGNLIGINTAIFSRSGGSVGIGFAIPSNMVRAIADELVEHGEVQRGVVGVALQPLNRDLARAFDIDANEGVVIVDVLGGSAADKAGLQVGDVITQVGDRRIRQLSDYDSQAAVMFIGDEVDVQIIRDGRKREVELDIEEVQRVDGRTIHERLAGATLENFNNPNDPGMSAGVLSTAVDPASTAFELGFRTGDVIVGLNRQPVRDISQLREAARRASGNRRVDLRVYRNGRFGLVRLR